MSIETVVALVSFGVSIMNCIAVGMMYLQHIRTIRNMVVSVAADETGEILIISPFEG